MKVIQIDIFTSLHAKFRQVLFFQKKLFKVTIVCFGGAKIKFGNFLTMPNTKLIHDGIQQKIRIDGLINTF